MKAVMRSAIADITPFYKRGTSYGIFNTGYGLALLLGSALMGWLYDRGQTGCIMVFVASPRQRLFSSTPEWSAG